MPPKQFVKPRLVDRHAKPGQGGRLAAAILDDHHHLTLVWILRSNGLRERVVAGVINHSRLDADIETRLGSPPFESVPHEGDRSRHCAIDGNQESDLILCLLLPHGASLSDGTRFDKLTSPSVNMRHAPQQSREDDSHQHAITPSLQFGGAVVLPCSRHCRDARPSTVAGIEHRGTAREHSVTIGTIVAGHGARCTVTVGMCQGDGLPTSFGRQ